VRGLIKNILGGFLGLYALFFFGVVGVVMFSIHGKDSIFKAQNNK